MTDWDFTEETIIGHHVAARIEEPSRFSKQIDDLADRLDLERMYDSPIIEIEVGDVDWDETKSVRMRLDVLERLVEQIGE